MLSSTAETKSFMARKQVGARGRRLGQGVGIARNNVKQLGEARQHQMLPLGERGQKKIKKDQKNIFTSYKAICCFPGFVASGFLVSRLPACRLRGFLASRPFLA